MCLIIDANMAHKFGDPPHEDVQPVVTWLFPKRKQRRKKRPRVVVGGKLRWELERAGTAIADFLATLDQAGQLLRIADTPVIAEEAEVNKLLEQENIPGANDPHVLALARVSGSRLLASADKRSRLQALFKDRRFLDPPGKVYQRASHQHLLRAAPDCKE